MRPRRDDEAFANPDERNRPWPPDHQRGFITHKGRKFHSHETCPGYLQGLSNNELLFGLHEDHAPEWMTAAEARALLRAPCLRCWDLS